MGALFNGPFHKISKGYHKYLIAQHFAQSLPSENEASHVLLCFHSHLPHCVVEKSLLPKGISFLQFCHEFVPLVHGCSSFLYNVKRRARVSLVHYHLPLNVLLSDEGSCNGVLVVIAETAEKPDILHKLLVLLVLLDDDLLNCFPEGVSVDGPETAVLACFN